VNELMGFEKHVVLYAKGWYKRTNDPIRDLKKLLSRYCMMETKYLHTNDIYQFLISTFLNTMNEKANTSVYSEAIAEMIGRKWGRRGMVKDRPAVRVLLGNIQICDGCHANMTIIFPEFAEKIG
jgi:hypothetical protein